MGITNHNHESIHDQKPTFLPMFCRLSIKDVVKQNTLPISAADPSSPTVTCIGQVKRTNRVSAFPTGHHHKPIKPRSKLHFSTKTLLSNPPPTATATARKSSCRSNREICVREYSRRSVEKNSCDYGGHCVEVVIDISKMDPPLPVVKRAAPMGNRHDEVNIWKRRLGGGKSKHIEPICLPAKRFQPPMTTV